MAGKREEQRVTLTESSFTISSDDLVEDRFWPKARRVLLALLKIVVGFILGTAMAKTVTLSFELVQLVFLLASCSWVFSSAINIFSKKYPRPAAKVRDGSVFLIYVIAAYAVWHLG